MLEKVLRRADRVRDEVRTLIAGEYLDTELKVRLGAAYTVLALDHHEAIATLVRARLYGSALALVRVVFEIVFISHWVEGCARPNQVKKLAGGKRVNFPEMAKVVGQVDKAYGTTFFTSYKEQGWKAMNDYTHSGIMQLSSQFDRDVVTGNYEPGIILSAVDITTIGVAIMGRFLTMAGNKREGERAGELLLEVLQEIMPKPAQS